MIVAVDYILLFLGVLFMIGSGLLRGGVVPPQWSSLDGPVKQSRIDRTQLWFAIIFTLALPLWWFFEWHVFKRRPEPPTALSEWQHDRKIITDLWVAIAVVLGVLFGIKKPDSGLLRESSDGAPPISVPDGVVKPPQAPVATSAGGDR